MRIAVASDVHLGAPHNELDDYVELIELDKANPGKVFLTGDIVDRTNCKKKELSYYTNVMRRLKAYFKDRYVLGNHEAHPIGKGYHIEKIGSKRVLFFHGPGVRIDDVYFPVYYSEAKTEKWENKKKGRGKFSYWKYKTWRMFSRHKGKYKKPSPYILEQTCKIARWLKCDVAIFGHSHRHYDGVHENIRVINVNKGITFLDIQ